MATHDIISCPVHIINFYSQEISSSEHLPRCFTIKSDHDKLSLDEDGEHIQFIIIYICI